MIRKYIKLFRRFLIISWQEIYVFRFEFMMVLFNLLFNFSFIFIFWYTLLNHIPMFNGWNFQELAIYTSVVFLGEGLGGFFFGFRDLPGKIVGGSLDKFLCRPINTLFAVLFEQVSVIYFIEQLGVSLVIIVSIICGYNIHISILSVVCSFSVLIIGVLLLNLIYGIITFLTFWVGRLEVFRDLLMQFTETKQYPITIFPKKLRMFLTYLLPVAFVSYYPTIILLDKELLRILFFIKLLVFLIIVYSVFIIVWRKGLKRYEANGG